VSGELDEEHRASARQHPDYPILIKYFADWQIIDKLVGKPKARVWEGESIPVFLSQLKTRAQKAASEEELTKILDDAQEFHEKLQAWHDAT